MTLFIRSNLTIDCCSSPSGPSSEFEELQGRNVRERMSNPTDLCTMSVHVSLSRTLTKWPTSVSLDVHTFIAQNLPKYIHVSLPILTWQHVLLLKCVLYHLLTPSLWRPYIHAIFFSTACRTACKHAFRFLRVFPEAVSTRHSWLWQTLDDVYTRRCFSESEGNTLRCPRTKGTAVSEWVNGMEWVNGFLHNPFIHDLFCWSSRHKFVKTDL